MAGLEREPYSLKADPFAGANDQNCAHRSHHSFLLERKRATVSAADFPICVR
jgi:hypothetical protein